MIKISLKFRFLRGIARNYLVLRGTLAWVLGDAGGCGSGGSKSSTVGLGRGLRPSIQARKGEKDQKRAKTGSKVDISRGLQASC